MTEKRRPRDQHRRDDGEKTSRASAKSQKPTEPAKLDESKMHQLLEEARQRVKPLVKREAEAELVTDEVLSFRLSGV